MIEYPTYAEVRAAIMTDVITAPAHWACYLINGDCSDMSDAEMEAADARFLGVDVVDVAKETYFSWNYRLFGGDAEGGEVADYTVIYR